MHFIDIDLCTLTSFLPCFFFSSACPQTDTAQLYNTPFDSQCNHIWIEQALRCLSPCRSPQNYRSTCSPFQTPRTAEHAASHYPFPSVMRKKAPVCQQCQSRGLHTTCCYQASKDGTPEMLHGSSKRTQWRRPRPDPSHFQKVTPTRAHHLPLNLTRGCKVNTSSDV